MNEGLCHSASPANPNGRSCMAAENLVGKQGDLTRPENCPRRPAITERFVLGSEATPLPLTAAHGPPQTVHPRLPHPIHARPSCLSRGALPSSHPSHLPLLIILILLFLFVFFILISISVLSLCIQVLPPYPRHCHRL